MKQNFLQPLIDPEHRRTLRPSSVLELTYC